MMTIRKLTCAVAFAMAATACAPTKPIPTAVQQPALPDAVRRDDRCNGTSGPSAGATTTSMQAGTIARLLLEKGFGFIRDENGVEYFFHRSVVRCVTFELLREGQHVEFQPEESAKGPRAAYVRPIEF
jgi:CspA family cold shock protein